MFTPFAFIQTFSSKGESYDPNAQAFISATDISGITATAINTLVLDLKSYNLWDKFYAFYPIIGIASSQQSYNLIDVNSYQINYAGFSHSLGGALALGQENVTIADTNFYCSSVADSASFSMGFYGSVNNQGGVDMGVFGSGNLNGPRFGSNIVGANLVLADMYNDSGDRIITSNSTGSGFWTISRTSTTSSKVYYNGNTFTTNTNTLASQMITNVSIPFGSNTLNDGRTGFYATNQEYRTVFIAQGLNDTENSDLYTAVQAFQTTLGRQV